MTWRGARLGVGLAPNRLIIDPAFHRMSAAEQERLDRRLGVGTPSYVEKGFEASTGWLFVFVPMILLALVGALVATGSVADSPRWRRVLLRVTGGSSVRLRSYAVCRTWLATACGTALGVAAGTATGLLLAWPGTAENGYDPLPRVAFDTPWLPIAALVVGFPLLAAALAALLPIGSRPPARS
ncbi:FtsX-like permease family protein [Nonomuraea glycinis]|uniref:FtsX-like permease family protein n=1 Tax=Nonomuraea glycinis TaxID=2047744 RepID=UPI0033ACB12E